MRLELKAAMQKEHDLRVRGKIMDSSVKKSVCVSLFIAISVLGSNMRIFGTIALDSMPAFVAGLLFGPVAGGSVGALGHLFSAMGLAFPYGLFVHAVISFFMFITVVIYALAYRWAKEKKWGETPALALAAFVGTIFNGPITLFAMIPLLGKPAFFALIGVLSVAAVVNIVLASMVFIALKNTRLFRGELS